MVETMGDLEKLIGDKEVECYIYLSYVILSYNDLRCMHLTLLAFSIHPHKFPH